MLILNGWAENLPCDTGGIDVESQDELMVQMKQQANVAIETSEAVIFLVDGKEGITPQIKR